MLLEFPNQQLILLDPSPLCGFVALDFVYLSLNLTQPVGVDGGCVCCRRNTTQSRKRKRQHQHSYGCVPAVCGEYFRHNPYPSFLANLRVGAYTDDLGELRAKSYAPEKIFARDI